MKSNTVSINTVYKVKLENHVQLVQAETITVLVQAKTITVINTKITVHINKSRSLTTDEIPIAVGHG